MNLLGFLSLFFAPLPVLFVVGRIRIVRSRKRETTPEAMPKLFAPELAPKDSGFLRRFTPVQRVYLRQQTPAARIGCIVVTWFVFSLLAPSLLSTSVNRYGLNVPQAQRAWYSFLLSVTFMPSLTIMIALFTAFFTVSGLAGAQPQIAFNRTRPIERRFLFWGRVLPAVLALVLGYATGIMLAFGALVAVYGPVWQHLNLSLQLPVLRSWQLTQLVWLLLSPWKIFVAIGADMVFVFGIAMVFLLQPLQFKNIPKVFFSLWIGLFVYGAYTVMGVVGPNSVMGISHTFPVLYRIGLTTDMSRAPASMTVYLIPLAISAIMLWLAQVAAARKETKSSIEAQNMPLFAYLRLYRKRLTGCALMSLLFAVAMLFFTTGEGFTDFGVLWHHLCGCPPQPADVYCILYAPVVCCFLMGLILGVGVGTGMGTEASGLATPGAAQMRFLFTRPTRRLYVVCAPILIAAAAILTFPAVGMLLLLGWLSMVHAPAIGHLVDIARLMPAANALSSHPTLLQALNSMHYARFYLSAVSVGICIFAFYFSQRWWMRSPHRFLRLLSLFGPALLGPALPVLGFLSKRIMLCLALNLTALRSLSSMPSVILIALHFVFAVVCLISAWQIARKAEL